MTDIFRRKHHGIRLERHLASPSLLLEGAKMTLLISVLGLLGGVIIGVIAGFARAYGGWLTNNIALVLLS